MRDKWELNSQLDKYARAQNEVLALDKEMGKLQSKLEKLRRQMEAARNIRDNAAKQVEEAVFVSNS